MNAYSDECPLTRDEMLSVFAHVQQCLVDMLLENAGTPIDGDEVAWAETFDRIFTEVASRYHQATGRDLDVDDPVNWELSGADDPLESAPELVRP